jgi:hypothetical protein
MPSCFPNGSSYWIPTQNPGPKASALPTNLTIPLFAPGSTSHLSATYFNKSISSIYKNNTHMDIIYNW